MEDHTTELPTVVRTGLFASSGLAVACALQPLDVVKIRLQAGSRYRGAVHCALSIAKREGMAALYSGTSAALLRHVTHAVAWVSAHSMCISTLTDQQPAGAAQRLLSAQGSLDNVLGFHLQLVWPNSWVDFASGGLLQSFAYGAVMGACAAIVSTPAEVAMVRMATDGLLPVRKRSFYRHVMHAMRRVHRESGFLSLWAGSFPTVFRSVISLGVSVPFYSQMRRVLISSGMPGDSARLHFCCSACTGMVSAVVTLPIDYTKTMIQYADKTKCHTLSPVQLLLKMPPWTAFRTVYRGLPPYVCKILLQSALAALCYEYLVTLYRWTAETHPPSSGER